MRRPQPQSVLLLICSAAFTFLGASGASAQEAPPNTAQQWSSKIVNTDEISSPSTPNSSVKPVAKAKKAPVTSVALTAAVAAAASGDIGAEIWLALRKCESGNRYDLNTGNGYYGAYQFAAGTWKKLGYSGMPHEATPAVQDEAARKLQAKGGWGQWPGCSRKIGVR